MTILVIIKYFIKKSQLLFNLKSFYLLLILFSYLFSFAPKNELIFKKNCLRLLNNGQYSFLAQYFSNYYPKIAKNSKQFDYIQKIIISIPFLKVKTKIINTYLSSNSSPNKKIYFLQALLSLFNKNYPLAISFLKKSDNPTRFFYIGIAYYKMKNYTQSSKWFKETLNRYRNKKTKSLKNYIQASLLKLSYSYFNLKNYQNARFYLNKVKDSPQKLILSYYIEKKNKSNKQYKLLETIKKKYKNSILVKEFIKKETK